MRFSIPTGLSLPHLLSYPCKYLSVVYQITIEKDLFFYVRRLFTLSDSLITQNYVFENDFYFILLYGFFCKNLIIMLNKYLTPND